MFRDNVPVIVLCQWCLEADYLEEEYLSGLLLPVLFANDAESAERGKRENPTNTMIVSPGCSSRQRRSAPKLPWQW